MRRRSLTFLVPYWAFLAAVAFWAGAAAAGPFSQLFVFGDSLSDVGNIAQASFDIYPGPYYYNDRFSNGPVFVEALSAGLGLGTVTRSTAGGNNFAYGGARTSGTGGFEGLFIRDIDEQVDQFLATRTVDPNALFLVYAGANDLLGGQTNVSIPVGNLAEDIGRLAAAGAGKFLVANLPLLGHTPRFNGNADTFAQYNARTSQFNASLQTMLDGLESTNAALTFFRLDVAVLFGRAIAAPAAFGLTNVTDPAAPDLAPGTLSYDTDRIAANAEDYLFWDDVHPTATVHGLLAQQALRLFFLPGDYNRDESVDAADYVVWRDDPAAFGGQHGYDTWRANFGRTAAAGGAGASGSASARVAVPEPASLVLWVISLSAWGFAAGRPTDRSIAVLR